MQRTATAERQLQIPGYQLLRRLNQSAAFSAYLTKSAAGSARLVLKVFPRPASRQADFSARFQQSCRTLSQLQHPHIARLHDGGVQDSIGYLAVEYVAGAEPIAEWSEEASSGQLLQQLAALARATHHAHGEGFVHGYIEAARVFIQGDKRIVLTGFEEQLLPTAPVVEEPQYLAPECHQGEAASVASDIYSLGMLLYCLLARRPPVTADFVAGEGLKSVAEGVPSLPGHLRVMQPLINQTLATEPAQRFRHAEMLALAIDAVTEEDLEAIRIASPHYLASLRNSSSEQSVLLEEESPLVAAAPKPANRAREQAQRQSRRSVSTSSTSRLWPLLLACAVLVIAAGAMFRDRLPPAAELVAWVETRVEAATIYLSGLRPHNDVIPPASAPAPVSASLEAVEPVLAESETVLETESLGSVQALHVQTEEQELPPSLLPEPQSSIGGTVDAWGREQLAENFVEEGDRLLAEDALTVPLDSNALSAYRQALALDPDNAQAWAGLQGIVRRYVQLVQARIDEGDWNRAGEFVRRGLSVDPNSRELLSLQSRLMAQVGPPDAGEVERLSAMARIQMVRENYVSPAGDSAYDHYNSLLLLDPDNPEARSGLARVERELASEIELQVNRNRFNQARTLLVKAQDAYPASQRFHRLTLALEAAMASEVERARLQSRAE